MTKNAKPQEADLAWDEERKSAMERGIVSIGRLREKPGEARKHIVNAIHEAVVKPFGGYKQTPDGYKMVDGTDHLNEFQQRNLIRSIEQLTDELLKSLGKHIARAGFAAINGSVDGVTLKGGKFKTTFVGDVEVSNGVVLSQLDGKSLLLVVADSQEYPLIDHGWEPESPQGDLLENVDPDLYFGLSREQADTLKNSSLKVTEEGDGWINPETGEFMAGEEALDFLKEAELAEAK